jgi:hypothetical protein
MRRRHRLHGLGAKPRSGCRVVKFKGGKTVKFCKTERTAEQKKKRISIAKANLKAAKPEVCTTAWKAKVRKASMGAGSAKQKAARRKNLMSICG